MKSVYGLKFNLKFTIFIQEHSKRQNIVSYEINCLTTE